MKISILILFLFSTFANVSHATNEALSIWKLPQNIEAKIIKSYSQGNIAIQEIQYTSGEYQKKPVKIFGYYCYPKNKKNLPAVAIIHGGGGYALLSRSVKFAKKGYAALSIDLPGKGELRWNKSRSTGPNMDVPTLLRVSPDVSYNYLYHAVPAAQSAITFLEQQPVVNKNKIAMLGLSWGGVITLITNGIDKRLASAIPVFGSGYLDQGSTWQARFDEWMSPANKKVYNEFIDAKNYLKTQHAPTLYMTGSNDHCYYIPNFIKSFRNMPTEKTKLAIYPNGRHRVSQVMQDNIFLWLHSTLKNKGRYPDIKKGNLAYKGNYLLLPVSFKGPYAAKKVSLYYSRSGVAAWTIKKWKEIKAHKYNGKHYIKIPKKLIKPEIIFYLGAKDTRGAFVTTPICALMQLRLSDGRTFFEITTPIEEINYHRISPKTWEKIFYTKPDIPGDSFWLANVERVGAKVTIKKDYYYIKLPKN